MIRSIPYNGFKTFVMMYHRSVRILLNITRIPIKFNNAVPQSIDYKGLYEYIVRRKTWERFKLCCKTICYMMRTGFNHTERIKDALNDTNDNDQKRVLRAAVAKTTQFWKYSCPRAKTIERFLSGERA